MTRSNQMQAGDAIPGGRPAADVTVKLIDEYLKAAKEQSLRKFDSRLAKPMPKEVVFSAAGDLELYGEEPLRKEFSSRIFDPYTAHREQLSAEAATLGVPNFANSSYTRSNENNG